MLSSSLYFNVWGVDKQRGTRTLDLLGAFHTTHNYGVIGQVWVETKVFSPQSFTKELDRSRKILEEVLRQEEAKPNSTFEPFGSWRRRPQALEVGGLQCFWCASSLQTAEGSGRHLQDMRQRQAAASAAQARSHP